MKSAVIDASVVLRWALADEADRAGAIRMADALRDGTIQAVAPPNFLLEVGAALVVALHDGRISRDWLDAVMGAVAGVAIDDVDPHQFAWSVVELALRTGIRVPDAAYVETARRTGSALVTGDRALARAARQVFIATIPLDAVPAWIPDSP